LRIVLMEQVADYARRQDLARQRFRSATGARALATPAAICGVFMPAIGWRWALLIWGYALAWFLVNGRIKLWASRLFDWQGGGLLTRLLGWRHPRVRQMTPEEFFMGFGHPRCLWKPSP